MYTKLTPAKRVEIYTNLTSRVISLSLTIAHILKAEAVVKFSEYWSFSTYETQLNTAET